MVGTRWPKRSSIHPRPRLKSCIPSDSRRSRLEDRPRSAYSPLRPSRERSLWTDNVLGEFGIRQLFAAWLKDDLAAGRAADGWKGDHYLVYGDSVAAS